MPLPARVQCPECDTWMLAMAPDVMETVGNMGGPEGELGFLEQPAFGSPLPIMA
jgi:hypothetical protein